MNKLLAALAFVVIGLWGSAAHADGAWAGCNGFGCWNNGGGCNGFGCWNGPRGSCNGFGCSDVGECNGFGCPRGDVRRHPRGAHRAATPIVYASPQPTIRLFDRDGLRFGYSSDFSAEWDGRMAQLTSPRVLFTILKTASSLTPDGERQRVVSNVKEHLAKQEQTLRSSQGITLAFDGVRRQGTRVTYDDARGTWCEDVFAWRASDGRNVSLILLYAIENEDEAYAYFGPIRNSID